METGPYEIFTLSLSLLAHSLFNPSPALRLYLSISPSLYDSLLSCVVIYPEKKGSVYVISTFLPPLPLFSPACFYRRIVCTRGGGIQHV
jgi:hypothetical protein